MPIEHRASPFDFTPEQWTATHELLLAAKAAWDERLAATVLLVPVPFK